MEARSARCDFEFAPSYHTDNERECERHVARASPGGVLINAIADGLADGLEETMRVPEVQAQQAKKLIDTGCLIVERFARIRMPFGPP